MPLDRANNFSSVFLSGTRTLGLIVLLSCQPVSAQVGRQSNAQDVGVRAKAQSVWDSVLTKCGDSYYENVGPDVSQTIPASDIQRGSL